jgi:hypothetical protein
MMVTPTVEPMKMSTKAERQALWFKFAKDEDVSLRVLDAPRGFSFAAVERCRKNFTTS